MLDPRFRGDDRQRGRPKRGDEAAVALAPDNVRRGIRPHRRFRVSAGAPLA